MATVFDILKRVGERLPGAWHTGVASSGSTTTVVDSRIGGVRDSWNGGTALIISTTDGLAPISQTRIINDYTSSDGTITTATAFTAAVGAGDRFGLIKPRYPREKILEYMNDALQSIKLPQVNDSSLDTAASTKDYNLPTGINENNLLQVYVATRSTAPFNWSPVYYWNVTYNGTNHVLTFDSYLASGFDIRLVYWTMQSATYADSGTIDSRIHPDLLVLMTLVRVLEDRYGKFNTAPARETSALNAALRREAAAIKMHMPRLPKKFAKLPMTSIYMPPVGRSPDGFLE